MITIWMQVHLEQVISKVGLEVLYKNSMLQS